MSLENASATPGRETHRTDLNRILHVVGHAAIVELELSLRARAAIRTHECAAKISKLLQLVNK